MPGIWDDKGMLVLSVLADRPAGADAFTMLARYEKLTAMAVLVSDLAALGSTEQALGLLRSRTTIEEAKGIVMALRRCDADEAWNTLRRASQEFNVKVRELAVALVEHVSGIPAPQSASGNAAAASRCPA